MKPSTIINTISVKPGKMGEFLTIQQEFGAMRLKHVDGYLGGRMYRNVEGTKAVLISQFASKESQDAILKSDEFKAHLERLKPLVESSSPGFYEEAYTAGNFK